VPLERSPAGLEQVQLTVTTAKGAKHRFIVEVAGTPEQQAYGLMNRQSLAPDRGMIFPYEPPRPVSFWRIGSIAENTVPLSLEPVVSTEPAEAVLEIGGGRAAELGIAAGDRVAWRH
jgi:uncharacterized membrane protein (UPF0127 family)